MEADGSFDEVLLKVVRGERRNFKKCGRGRDYNRQPAPTKKQKNSGRNNCCLSRKSNLSATTDSSQSLFMTHTTKCADRTLTHKIDQSPLIPIHFPAGQVAQTAKNYNCKFRPRNIISLPYNVQRRSSLSFLHAKLAISPAVEDYAFSVRTVNPD